MAKTRFTEERVKRLQTKADFELWIINMEIAANIRRWEEKKQTANQTRKKHIAFVERFKRLLQIEVMILDAANKIDGCERSEERYYVSAEYMKEAEKYINHCAYFEK